MNELNRDVCAIIGQYCKPTIWSVQLSQYSDNAQNLRYICGRNQDEVIMKILHTYINDVFWFRIFKLTIEEKTLLFERQMINKTSYNTGCNCDIIMWGFHQSCKCIGNDDIFSCLSKERYNEIFEQYKYYLTVLRPSAINKIKYY